jgi:hypothetical protein
MLRVDEMHCAVAVHMNLSNSSRKHGITYLMVGRLAALLRRLLWALAPATRSVIGVYTLFDIAAKSHCYLLKKGNVECVNRPCIRAD